MQKAIRFNESQILYLANKARQENTLCSYLYKKSSDTGKWQLRWFILYQNFLFYFENETSSRPSGVALLEGSFCDRAIATTTGKGKDEKQVSKFFETPHPKKKFLEKKKRIFLLWYFHNL